MTKLVLSNINEFIKGPKVFPAKIQIKNIIRLRNWTVLSGHVNVPLLRYYCFSQTWHRVFTWCRFSGLSVHALRSHFKLFKAISNKNISFDLTFYFLLFTFYAIFCFLDSGWFKPWTLYFKGPLSLDLVFLSFQTLNPLF